MKAVTMVAGLAGTVAAGSAHKHARLHARDTTGTTDWPEWESSTTTTTTTTSASTVWPEWDPATTTTTTTSSWGEWDPATTTTTSSSASGWGEWEAAATSSSTTSSGSFDWSAWDPSTSTVAAAAATTGWGADPSVCAQQVIYITGSGVWAPDVPTTSSVTATSYTTLTLSPTAAATTWAEWTSSSSDPGAATTWADWTSSSTVSAAATTWAEWSSSSSDPAAATTWADWTSSSTVSAAATTTWADWTSSAASTASASGWAKPSGGSSGTLGSSNSETWAMTYSPYTSSGGCKDAGTVSSDISAIAGKGFSTIRVYSTDCSTLQNVGSAARANNMKLILGVFISSTGISGAQGQVTDIVKWAQWDIVELVVVGNEAVFNGYCSASALAGFISSTKSTLAGAGYTGPVSTTEPIETWLESGSTFCGVVDVVAANLYAFFNAQTTADKAGPFIQSEITELEAICSGKDVYVMETGWPHAGNCNGAACPSYDNQATAINSIKSVVGAKVVFFSFEDDAWKAPGQFDVEQYWGCADVFSGN